MVTRVEGLLGEGIEMGRWEREDGAGAEVTTPNKYDEVNVSFCGGNL